MQMTMDMSASSNSSATLPHPSAPTQIEFTGKGAEYFGIWIVNILLSIITLGIYSAWAKVRTNQYFYGHTHIDGHSLRYLATPMQILRGRIIAAALFIIYTIASTTSPTAGSILFLIIILIAPLLIVKSLRFTLGMTSYRNVRFGFAGSYGTAYLHFIALPILAIVTVGLAAPWVMKRIDQFINGNARYGDRSFDVDTHAGRYYWACFCTIIAATCVFLIALGISAALIALGDTGRLAGALIAVLFTLYVYSIIGAVYSGIVRNHLYNSTSIEGVGKLHSDINPMAYSWLFFSNTILTIFTLGLAYPWTKVRRAVFLANATQVTIEPGIDSVVETLEANASAFGEEAAGFFDVDVAIG
jgi:uncharacterized membrane protein YjgN (DUF898 family)